MSEGARHYSDRQRGEEYQDFIVKTLAEEHNIMLCLYTSSKYQREHGEGVSGVEIKLDEESLKYGNWYIETEHRPSPEPYIPWRPGGVMRDDNAWLYLIGNYNEAMLMSKYQLRFLIERTSPEWKAKRGIVYRDKKPTSHGYTFPIGWCKSFLCLKHFVFGGRSE